MHPTPVETAISNEAIEWFSKLHSGRATPVDYRQFEAWRRRSPEHAKAYADVEAFWALLDEPAQRVFEQEEAEACLKACIDSPIRKATPPVARRPMRRAFAGLALASTVAIALWLPGAIRFWTSDFHTQWGERRDFTLEDGSRISLNTHSALSVEFSPKQRLVQLLEGEAFFQVTHDPARPFVVATSHSRVQV